MIKIFSSFGCIGPGWVALWAAIGLSACSTGQVPRTSAALAHDTLAIASAATAPLVAPDNVAQVHGSSQDSAARAAAQQRRAALVHSKRAFLGNTVEPIRENDRLPPVFHAPFQFFVDAQGQTDLHKIAARIQNTTRVSIRIAADVQETGAPAGQAGKIPGSNGGGTPAPPLLLDGLAQSYAGTLAQFLTILCNRAGLNWSYVDGTVIISRFITRAYELEVASGSSAYRLGSGSSTGGAAASAQTNNDAHMSVEESGSSNPVEAMKAVLEKMIQGIPGSTVVGADSMLVVTTSGDMHRAVANLIEQRNKGYRKQALIELDIYAIQKGLNDELGINWQGIFNSLNGLYGVTVSSPNSLTSSQAGQSGLSILHGSGTTSQRWGGSSALLSALNQQSHSVQHRVVTLVAPNGRWASSTDRRTLSYISETTPGAANLNGPGIPGIKTDRITVGDQFQVMPTILANGETVLRIGISMSELLALTPASSGSGANVQTVQNPDVHGNNQEFTARLAPGEVMVITGLSRLVNSTSQRRLGDAAPLLAGGSDSNNLMREWLLVLVRVVAL